MNNYLIKCAIAAAIFTSCSEDIADIYPASSNVINYTVETVAQPMSRGGDSFVLINSETGDSIYAHLIEVQNDASRGMPINAVSGMASDIGIAAYYKAKENGSSVEYFTDVLECDADDGSCKTQTGKTYYWPSSGYLDFIAYSPATLDYADKKITYEMSEDPTEQSDILICTLNNNSKTKNDVALSFDHICSQVTFRIGAGLGDGVISKIELTDIKYKGTYDFEKGSWVIDNDKKSFTIDNIGGVSSSTYTDEDPTAMPLNEKTLMLIPQRLSNVQMTVKYGNYTIDEASKTYTIEDEQTYSTTLSSTTIEPGKSYYIVLSNKVSAIGLGATSPIVYTDYDSYYFMTEFKFKVSSSSSTWKIAANQDWLTFRKDQTDYAKMGFWIDEEKGEATLEGTSADVDSEGYVTVYAYCTENATTSSREATVMMIQDGEIQDCSFIRQLPPISAGSYYTANTEYEKTVQWGFYNTWGSMSFVCPSDLVSQIDTSSSGISASGNTVTINFSNTASSVSTKNDEGLMTTKNLFFHYSNSYGKAGSDNLGYLVMLQTALALSQRADVTTTGDIDTFLSCAFLRAAQYNKFTYTTLYGVKVPDISESDIAWFLPGTTEISTTGLTSGHTYWTSTGYSGNNDRSYTFTSTGTSGNDLRSQTYYVRAVRSL